MIQIERRVGRLVEMSAGALDNPEDLRAVPGQLEKAVSTVPSSEHWFLVVDYRSIDVLLGNVVERIRPLVGQNARLPERVAILVAPMHAIARLQLARVLTSSRAQLRLTDSPSDVEEFMADALKLDERARLHAFVASPGGA